MGESLVGVLSLYAPTANAFADDCGRPDSDGWRRTLPAQSTPPRHTEKRGTAAEKNRRRPCAWWPTANRTRACGYAGGGWRRPCGPRERWDDLPALTAIYNHYVHQHPRSRSTSSRFAPEARRPWFDAQRGLRTSIVCLVAADSDDDVLGYATASRWRPKAAYDTTVESSVYCRPRYRRSRAVGDGALFGAVRGADDRRRPSRRRPA